MYKPQAQPPPARPQPPVRRARGPPRHAAPSWFPQPPPPSPVVSVAMQTSPQKPQSFSTSITHSTDTLRSTTATEAPSGAIPWFFKSLRTMSGSIGIKQRGPVPQQAEAPAGTRRFPNPPNASRTEFRIYGKYARHFDYYKQRPAAYHLFGAYVLISGAERFNAWYQTVFFRPLLLQRQYCRHSVMPHLPAPLQGPRRPRRFEHLCTHVMRRYFKTCLFFQQFQCALRLRAPSCRVHSLFPQGNPAQSRRPEYRCRSA